MRKYLAITKAAFQTSLIYRVDILFWGTSELIDTLVFLFIWIKIFGEKQAVAGFTLAETITYLIGVGLVANLIVARVHRDLERDVQTGRLSAVLARPMSYFWARVASNIAEKPLNFIIRLGVYLLVAFAFRSRFVVNRSLVLVFLCGLSIVFAAAINFLINFLIGCIAFWAIRARGIFALFRPIGAILSGGYAPITFFPLLFQQVAGLLPFVYTRYFPMLIYLGKISGGEIFKGFLVQLFWITVLSLLSRRLWRQGLKRYEGVGI